MNHQQKLDEYAVISIATAAAILGGDGGPVSPGTVYRLVREGRLSKAGKGKVTTESLRRYLAEGRQAHVPAAPGRSAPERLRHTPRPAHQAQPAGAEDWRRLIRYPKGQAAK